MRVGEEAVKRQKLEAVPREARSAEGGPEEHRSFNSVVGDAIRKARQEHAWTQAVLAEQAGLSPNYIARLERGELGPSLFVANQICEALSIALETLVAPGGFSARRTGKRRVISG